MMMMFKINKDIIIDGEIMNIPDWKKSNLFNCIRDISVNQEIFRKGELAGIVLETVYNPTKDEISVIAMCKETDMKDKSYNVSLTIDTEKELSLFDIIEQKPQTDMNIKKKPLQVTACADCLNWVAPKNSFGFCGNPKGYVVDKTTKSCSNFVSLDTVIEEYCECAEPTDDKIFGIGKALEYLKDGKSVCFANTPNIWLSMTNGISELNIDKDIILIHGDDGFVNIWSVNQSSLFMDFMLKE